MKGIWEFSINLNIKQKDSDGRYHREDGQGKLRYKIEIKDWF